MINKRRVWTVMRKDWRELMRNKQVAFSLVIVPMVFALILPSLFIFLGASVSPDADEGITGIVGGLAGGAIPAGYNVPQAVVYAIIVYFMAPFFLVIPVLVANITASSSFVGEKERGTIEGLLYTPLSNRELVIAKVISSFAPSIVLTWIAFLVYTLIAGTMGARAVGEIFFPTLTWLVMVVVIVPLISCLATSLIVMVSTKASTTQGAQGMAMFIVLPILAIVISQTVGLMLFDISLVLVAAPILIVLDALAFVFVVARFDRERIVTRL